MIDIRAQLARDYNNGPNRKRNGPPRYIVLHWVGEPSVYTDAGQYKGDINLIKGYARYHVLDQKWDGLSYHRVIGRDNDYLTRDDNDMLYHAGVKLFNEEALAILTLYGKNKRLGKNDPVSDSMWHRLWTMVKDRLTAYNLDWRYVLGHQESPRTTDCPGAAIVKWLAEQRLKVNQPVDNVFVKYNATIRDDPSTLSDRKGLIISGAKINGEWMLGKPVGGDSLWLRISGDRFVHSSALDTSSYRPVR